MKENPGIYGAQKSNLSPQACYPDSAIADSWHPREESRLNLDNVNHDCYLIAMLTIHITGDQGDEVDSSSSLTYDAFSIAASIILLPLIIDVVHMTIFRRSAGTR